MKKEQKELAEVLQERTDTSQQESDDEFRVIVALLNASEFGGAKID